MKMYKCLNPACDKIYVTEESARLCCPPLVKYECRCCEFLHNSQQDAMECCNVTATNGCGVCNESPCMCKETDPDYCYAVITECPATIVIKRGEKYLYTVNYYENEIKLSYRIEHTQSFLLRHCPHNSHIYYKQDELTWQYILNDARSPVYYSYPECKEAYHARFREIALLGNKGKTV